MSNHYEDTAAAVVRARLTRAELQAKLLAMAKIADLWQQRCKEMEAVANHANNLVVQMIEQLKDSVAKSQQHAERMALLVHEREDGGGPTGQVH